MKNPPCEDCCNPKCPDKYNGYPPNDKCYRPEYKYFISKELKEYMPRLSLFHWLFHSWEEFYCWEPNEKLHGGIQVNAHFRHCTECGKWQLYVGSWGGCWWEDSDPPEEKHLTPIKEFNVMRDATIRKQNAICCTKSKKE